MLDGKMNGMGRWIKKLLEYSSLGVMRVELRQRGGKNGQGKSGMKLTAVSEVEWIGLGIRFDVKRRRRRLCHF